MAVCALWTPVLNLVSGAFWMVFAAGTLSGDSAPEGCALASASREGLSRMGEESQLKMTKRIATNAVFMPGWR